MIIIKKKYSYLVYIKISVKQFELITLSVPDLYDNRDFKYDIINSYSESRILDFAFTSPASITVATIM